MALDEGASLLILHPILDVLFSGAGVYLDCENNVTCTLYPFYNIQIGHVYTASGLTLAYFLTYNGRATTPLPMTITYIPTLVDTKSLPPVGMHPFGFAALFALVL